MNLPPLIWVCRVVGHKRTGYDPDGHPDNYRRRRRWYQRCDRCGATDAEEVFREGWVEPLMLWRLRAAIHGKTYHARWWWRTCCEDCKQPLIRFGRPVGDHTKCDVFPF